MPLEALLEKLYARRRFGIKPGVERVAVLLAKLGNPEKKFRSIHVVGTNGKGSTSAFLSSILKHSGYRTAQFSSPHLIRFTERFRIDGEEYQSDSLARNLETVLSLAPDEATFFEITTALAALVFNEAGVELAVIEAGMGGRSDATAAISGEMTLITPVDIDHAEYLGATIVRIAEEKTGIIRPFTRVVSAGQHDEVIEVIKSKCNELNCRLAVMGTDFSAEWNQGATLDYHGIHLKLSNMVPGIPGRYQLQNAALALAAAESLDLTVVPVAFTAGVSDAYWPGRMELVHGEPPLLLDGAHNPAGSAALAEALADYPRRRLLLVAGICSDKNAEEFFAPLVPLAERVYTATPSVERAMNSEELAGLFASMGVEAISCSSVADAIQNARSESAPGDLILVSGSLFIVGEAKAWLENTNFSGIRG